MSNVEVRRRANAETISKLVRKRRCTWIGHKLCMDNSCLPRVAMTRAPERKCKRGRPKETWKRTVEKEWMAMDLNSWVEAGLAAANRVSWRSTIFGPIHHTGKRNWWWIWPSSFSEQSLCHPLCYRLHVINLHLTEVKWRCKLAAMNDFCCKLANCLGDGSFPVFNGNNLLFAFSILFQATT